MSTRILKRSEYNAILRAIKVCPPRKSLERIKQDFPSVDAKTLWSINNVVYSEKMRKNSLMLKRKPEFMTLIYEPLIASSSGEDPQTLLILADKFDIAPSLVAKRVLEEYYSSHKIPTSIALEGTGIKSLTEKKATIQPSPQTKPTFCDTSVAILYMHCAVEKLPMEFTWVSAQGPDHKPVFTVNLTLNHANQAPEIFSGTDSTKSLAKQAAANRALETLTLRDDLQARYEKVKCAPEKSQNKSGSPAALEVLNAFNQNYSVEYTAEGPPHKTTFTAKITVPMPDSNVAVTASGLTKKAAKQSAAYKTCLLLPLPQAVLGKLHMVERAQSPGNQENDEPAAREAMREVTDAMSQLNTKLESVDKVTDIEVLKITQIESKDSGSAFTSAAVIDKENSDTLHETDKQRTSQTVYQSSDVKTSEVDVVASDLHQDDSSCTATDDDYMQFAGKKTINLWMREPHRIPDKFLSQQVSVCISTDKEYGPMAMAMQASVGQEFEFRLLEHIRKHDLHYQDENYLRRAGYDKTPDIKLDVPIAVDGKVINWIESKAIFANEKIHKRYLDEQLWSYWNRFGAGLVIYWFGYISDIEDNSDKGILVRDCFPENVTTMDCFSIGKK